MGNIYSAADEVSLREALSPGVEKAKLVTAMQVEAAMSLAKEKGLPADPASIVVLAQIIATNWTGID